MACGAKGVSRVAVKEEGGEAAAWAVGVLSFVSPSSREKYVSKWSALHAGGDGNASTRCAAHDDSAVLFAGEEESDGER